ncbi:ankyrin repeat domain-containing protein [Oscillospiraceae bacterium 50-60]|nr:ankyrin repeat domain-containing protein [Oscillibacter sp.]
MKKLFQAIRQGNTAAVRELLEKKPELISCTAKQPPKKDDGQSPLQVALKTNRLEIAEYLLDLGADVNFMEAEDCASGWRAPVLHDAVNAAVMNSRWSVNSQAMYGGIKVFHTREEADRAYLILKRMLDLGADIRGVDSYGNSCVWRVCLQARQILPAYNRTTRTLGTDRILTPELREDLTRIFTLLYDRGMETDYIKPGESVTVRGLYKNEPVAQFLVFD